MTCALDALLGKWEKAGGGWRAFAAYFKTQWVPMKESWVMLYRVKALGSEDLLVTGNSTIEAYHGILKALVLDVLKFVPHSLPIRYRPH